MSEFLTEICPKRDCFNDMHNFSRLTFYQMLQIKVESQATETVLDILERLLSETGSATDATHEDLTTADRQGDTVVHWAARRGCCRRLRPLLNESVVSVRNQSGVTPLHVAADRGLSAWRSVLSFSYCLRCLR